MDIKILFPTGAAVDLNTTLAADLSLVDGLFETDASLYTATVISLFTDARAGKDDELPATETFRRGWWGDGVPSAGVPAGDRIGSRLWLLSRRKQTEETRLLAVFWTHEALNWTVEDGHVAAVHVAASWAQGPRGLLLLAVEYEHKNGARENYSFALPVGAE